MKPWIGGTVSRILENVAKGASNDDRSRIVLDSEAEGGERPMTMLELLKAGLARRMDLYILPAFNRRGQYRTRDGNLYVWRPDGVRRIEPLKTPGGKSGHRIAKRDRRLARERVAYLRAKALA